MEFHNQITRVLDFVTGARELGFHPTFQYTPQHLIK